MFEFSLLEFIRVLGTFLILLVFPGWLLVKSFFRGSCTLYELLPASFGGSLFLYFPTLFLWKSGDNGLLISGIMLLVFSTLLVTLRFTSLRAHTNQKKPVSFKTLPSIESGIVILLLLIVILSMLYQKGTLGVTHDSFDHLSAIREVRETGEVFPRRTFYTGGDGDGLDPRKGIFQPALALVSSISGVDPVRMWVFLPVILAPILILSFYSFSKQILRGRLLPIFSLFLFIVASSGSGIKWLRMSAYGNRIAEGLIWIALVFFLKFVREGGRKTLLFSVFLAIASVSVHMFSFFYLAVAGMGYLLFLLIYRGADRKEVLGRAVSSGVLLLLTLIPLALFRVSTFGPALNPIHTHEQGLLYFKEGLYVINPLAAPHGGGWTLLISIFLIPVIAGHAMKSSERVFLLGSSVLPILLALNPLVVPLLVPRMGYLVQRFIYVIPYLLIISLFAIEVLPSLRMPRRYFTRLYSAFVFLVLVVFLKGNISETISSYSRTSILSERTETPLAWVSALEFLEKNISEPSTILSDPVTSYSIPAFTRHRTVAVLHQHSSPTDGRAIERLDDASDVLNPFVSMTESLNLIKKHGAKFILLNQTFDKPIFLYRGTVDPELYDKEREKFDRFPEFFKRIVSEKEYAIYEVVETNTAQEVRDRREEVPFVLPTLPPGAKKPQEAFHAYGISLQGVSFPEEAGRGSSIGMNCYWKKISEVSSGLPFYVFVRFDREFKKGTFYRQSYGKLYRKFIEKKSGHLLRFREDHVPVRGVFPPRRWPPEKIIMDEFTISVPRTLAPGFYDVRVKLSAEPMLSNFSIKDFFVDEDYFSGSKVGRILIR